MPREMIPAEGTFVIQTPCRVRVIAGKIVGATPQFFDAYEFTMAPDNPANWRYRILDEPDAA